MAWREASGKGTVYTFSVMRRVKKPYVIAHATLAEGPTMLTNIVDCDADKVRIGQPVIVVFQCTENGPPVPMFGAPRCGASRPGNGLIEQFRALR